MGNAQIKLVFPTHGLPFAVPYSMVNELESKVERILKDMEKKGRPKGTYEIKLSNGTVIDPPCPGDWVLVDLTNYTIIHVSFIPKLIYSKRAYMVLPIRAANLSPEGLKEAVEIVNSNCASIVAGLPKYTP